MTPQKLLNQLNLDILRYANEKATFNIEDIREIFHLSRADQVPIHVRQGLIPPHDFVSKSPLSKKRPPPRHYWKKSTVVNAINKLREECEK